MGETLTSENDAMPCLLSSYLGVDDTLGDALPVEVGEQVDEVVVLEEERSALADSLGLVRVWDGDTIGGRVDEVLVDFILLVVVSDLLCV